MAKSTLPSPPMSFLTDVFDDVDAVADCLGAVSIAQQPEKKENRKCWFGHRQAGD